MCVRHCLTFSEISLTFSEICLTLPDMFRNFSDVLHLCFRHVSDCIDLVQMCFKCWSLICMNLSENMSYHFGYLSDVVRIVPASFQHLLDLFQLTSNQSLTCCSVSELFADFSGLVLDFCSWLVHTCSVLRVRSSRCVYIRPSLFPEVVQTLSRLCHDCSWASA